MYLSDIVDACDAISDCVRGKSEGEFLASRLLRSATERESAIIGEAVIQLLAMEPVLEERITDARKIAHFRQIVVHAYDLIDPRRMWMIALANVPTLRHEAAQILAERSEENRTGR